MIINIFFCILFSYLITYFFIPIFKKKSWVSFPNQRTSHKGIIPVGGSLGFIFVSSISFFFNKEYYFFLFLILSIIGLIDDLKGLGNKVRLLTQILIGIIFSILVYKDSIFNYLYSPNSFFIEEIILITFMTFLFVSIVNFTNFADGLDGLVGSSMIIIFLFAAYLLNINYIFLVGGLIGFLILNWYPAKVFMGDSGSLYLGSIYVYTLLRSYTFNEFLGIKTHDGMFDDSNKPYFIGYNPSTRLQINSLLSAINNLQIDNNNSQNITNDIIDYSEDVDIVLEINDNDDDDENEFEIID